MVPLSDSKQFPGFSRIYIIEEPGNSVAFRGNISLSVDDAFAITRGEKRPDRVEVRWAMGRGKPTDVIGTTVVAPVIVANRVLDLLSDAGITGWDTYPVDVFGKNGEAISGYRGLVVLGRCGAIDRSKSLKLDKVYPGGIFPVWKGLYFAPESWDGSDLFMPAGRTCWIFCLEAVKRILERAKVKNVTFTALAELELPMP